MNLYVYNSDAWLFLSKEFENIDWYKNNFERILKLYEENKGLKYDSTEIGSMNGKLLKYIIFADGEIKIKRNTIVTESIVEKIQKYKLKII